ncbi:MAG: hypothetical protein IJ699_06605, partial [Bacteroidaceae bacterium]|nr:hypothetical protein [Bacteroidaceae bacterium]
MKTILVTGACGQLGNEMQLQARLHPEYRWHFTDVVAPGSSGRVGGVFAAASPVAASSPSSPASPASSPVPPISPLDITDPAAVST